MGKYDDTGIFSPNKFKKKDVHPSHKGVINLSHATLKALLASYQDTGEAKLEVAGWRKKDNPDMISLKIQLPRDSGDNDRDRGRDDRGDGRDRDNDRSRGSYRRDDDDFPGDRVRAREEGRRDRHDVDDRDRDRDGPRSRGRSDDYDRDGDL